MDALDGVERRHALAVLRVEKQTVAQTEDAGGRLAVAPERVGAVPGVGGALQPVEGVVEVVEVVEVRGILRLLEEGRVGGVSATEGGARRVAGEDRLVGRVVARRVGKIVVSIRVREEGGAHRRRHGIPGGGGSLLVPTPWSSVGVRVSVVGLRIVVVGGRRVPVAADRKVRSSVAGARVWHVAASIGNRVRRVGIRKSELARIYFS